MEGARGCLLKILDDVWPLREHRHQREDLGATMVEVRLVLHLNLSFFLPSSALSSFTIAYSLFTLEMQVTHIFACVFVCASYVRTLVRQLMVISHFKHTHVLLNASCHGSRPRRSPTP